VGLKSCRSFDSCRTWTVHRYSADESRFCGLDHSYRREYVPRFTFRVQPADVQGQPTTSTMADLRDKGVNKNFTTFCFDYEDVLMENRQKGLEKYLIRPEFQKEDGDTRNFIIILARWWTISKRNTNSARVSIVAAAYRKRHTDIHFIAGRFGRLAWMSQVFELLARGQSGLLDKFKLKIKSEHRTSNYSTSYYFECQKKLWRKGKNRRYINRRRKPGRNFMLQTEPQIQESADDSGSRSGLWYQCHRCKTW